MLVAPSLLGTTPPFPIPPIRATRQLHLPARVATACADFDLLPRRIEQLHATCRLFFLGEILLRGTWLRLLLCGLNAGDLHERRHSLHLSLSRPEPTRTDDDLAPPHPRNLPRETPSGPSIPRRSPPSTAKMVKQNDVIAIIVIILFLVLALISFGIYRLVHTARNEMSVTSNSESSSSSSGSESIVDH